MKPFTVYKSDQTAGFTLIEVLVVVIIAGVLAAIAAPGWLAFLNRQRVSAVKSDLIQTLKNAQQDAIQRRRSLDVKIVDSATVPTVEVNGLTQVLGSDASNAGALRLTSYVVSGGTLNESFDTIRFDYQGRPIIGTQGTETSFSDASLPFVISISAANSSAKQCVIVASLLGSLKTVNGADCNNPSL